MARTFRAQVDKIVAENKDKLLRVGKTATINLINDAQTPVAKGGKMRVDTGFLRASGQVSLDGVPVGPSRHGEASTPQDAAVVIANATLTDSVWFGWTAEYAKYREAFDGFLASALQNWQEHVNRAVRKVK